MTTEYEGNLEFLNFIADISDPGTGEIIFAELASWLGLSAADLTRRWHASGRSEWNDYADDVLRVLDRMHDQTHSLARTLYWYRTQPLAIGDDLTGDQLVSTGRACEALRQIRAGNCRLPQRTSQLDSGCAHSTTRFYGPRSRSS